jgi:hypothetical protein
MSRTVDGRVLLQEDLTQGRVVDGEENYLTSREGVTRMHGQLRV